MRSKRLFIIWILAFVAVGSAKASSEPIRVSFLEGSAGYESASEVQWYEVVRNLPMLTGDRISTDPDSRLELETSDFNFIRIGSSTDIAILSDTGGTTELDLSTGDLILRIHNPHDFKVRTPWATVSMKEPGRYRLTAMPGQAVRMLVHEGQAAVTNPTTTQKLQSGEQLTVGSYQSALQKVAYVQTKDEFDLWSDRRDAELSYSPSMGYIAGYKTGVHDLDRWGSWSQTKAYGTVWVPWVGWGWVPYRSGRWCYYPGFGWTWVSYEPWGWLPYHSGNWVYVGSLRRWCWVPGQLRGWSPHTASFYHNSGHIGWSPRGPNRIAPTAPNFGMTVVSEDDFGVNRPERRVVDPDSVAPMRPGLPGWASSVTVSRAGDRSVTSFPDRVRIGSDPSVQAVRGGSAISTWSGRTSRSTGTTVTTVGRPQRPATNSADPVQRGWGDRGVVVHRGGDETSASSSERYPRSIDRVYPSREGGRSSSEIGSTWDRGRLGSIDSTTGSSTRPSGSLTRPARKPPTRAISSRPSKTLGNTRGSRTLPSATRPTATRPSPTRIGGTRPSTRPAARPSRSTSRPSRPPRPPR